MVDRVWEPFSCDKVVVDDAEAAYKGMKYLINTGCKTIAMVTAIDQSSVGQLRMQGYQKALQDFGIDYDKNLVVNLREGDDLDILMTLLLNYKKIDAIIGLDEMTADREDLRLFLSQRCNTVRVRSRHYPRVWELLSF